jgi:hypothetical protein
MKRITLLLLVVSLFTTTILAQKKQQKKITGFAITAQEKGGRSWKEVRLMDISTGEELKTIYESTKEMEALNARTGKAIVKKNVPAIEQKTVTVRKIVNLDMELEKAQGNNVARTGLATVAPRKMIVVRGMNREIQTDQPFATNSAAMAYDKKHERLYYTPMGINQLRYIDLKSKTPRLYYFEDEAFGKVAGMHDVPNQVTRMVIAADGNGYALSNDANHLIRFTTGKKPVITDLGALTDHPSNGTNSVHSNKGYGGDIIADAADNLYLITANRNVFRIGISSRTATFKGTIKGLPAGFSTNGAMVEEGSKVIIASSQSTVGYYRFDLNTLQAEKASAEGMVFNASDLANGNLAFSKKKKDRKDPEEVKEETKDVAKEDAKSVTGNEMISGNSITVYPNPVTNGMVKLSFADQPAGKYQVQLIDLAGRTIRSQEVNIQNKLQVVDFQLPDIASGSYLVKVASETNKVSVVNKIVVQ